MFAQKEVIGSWTYTLVARVPFHASEPPAAIQTVRKPLSLSFVCIYMPAIDRSLSFSLSLIAGTFVGDSTDAVYRQVLAFSPLAVRSVVLAAAKRQRNGWDQDAAAKAKAPGQDPLGVDSRVDLTAEVLGRTAASSELCASEPAYLQEFATGE